MQRPFRKISVIVRIATRRYAPFQTVYLIGLAYFVSLALSLRWVASAALLVGGVVLSVWAALFALDYERMATNYICEGGSRSEKLYDRMRQKLPSWLYDMYVRPHERRRSRRGSLATQRAFHGVIAIVVIVMLVTWAVSAAR